MAFSDQFDPGPQIAQCGTVNLGTKDIEKSLFFFRDTLGMEEVERKGNVSYLRCYQELGHHSLVLTEQEEAVVNAFSFRVKRPQDVALFHEELTRQGIEVLQVPAGAEAGRGEAIRFLLPGGGHPFELYYDMEKPLAPESMRSRLPSNSSKRRGLGVRRIDHFNIQTSPDTINQAESWVRDTLGFKRREFAHLPNRPGTVLASWMSVTPQVHDLAIVANGLNKTAQLHHIAFNLQDFSDVLTAADTLRDLDVSYGVGPGKHGIGQAMYLYIHDPGSDHRVELYAGGYLIFDPDWKAIEWEQEAFPDGMTWYGDPIDTSTGSRGRHTTGCAGLYRNEPVPAPAK
ncbi:VOC family protein [Martelella sp. FLE1502]